MVSQCKSFFLLTSLILLTLIVTFPRAIYPTLHGDESLYIGAALRMINGDFFLTDFWFDKLFLAPLMIAIGILIGGKIPLGFHLAGYVCAAIAVSFYVKVAIDLIPKSMNRSSLTKIGVGVFAYGIMMTPYMMDLHGSSFTEPMLLFFLILSLKNVFEDHRNIGVGDLSSLSKCESRAYHYFILAALCKMSSLMWTPLFLLYWLFKFGWQGLYIGPQRMLKTGRVWIVLALFWSLTNPTKLASFASFGSIFVSGASRPNHGFFTRFFGWVQNFYEIFPVGTLIAALFLLVYVTVASVKIHSKGMIDNIFDPRKISKHTQLLLMLNLPFWLHFAGLWLSGAQLFLRYLYILVPQFGLCIISLVIFDLNNKLTSRTLFSKLIPKNPIRILILMVFGLIFCFHGFSNAWDNPFTKLSLRNPSWGRAFHQVAEEMSPQSFVHNEGRQWYFFPYQSTNDVREICD